MNPRRLHRLVIFSIRGTSLLLGSLMAGLGLLLVGGGGTKGRSTCNAQPFASSSNQILGLCCFIALATNTHQLMRVWQIFEIDEAGGDA